MSRKPCSLWIFGPIASGKSQVISRLSLENCKVVQADSELERRADAAGLHLDVKRYDKRERALFERLRNEATTDLWNQVARWRGYRFNIIYETIGDNPDLFRDEIESDRARGYRTRGCGLRVPLEQCLANNRERRRILSSDTLSASWHTFERFVLDGTYERLFEHDELLISPDAALQAALANAWLHRQE